MWGRMASSARWLWRGGNTPSVVASLFYVGAVFGLLRLGPWNDSIKQLLEVTNSAELSAWWTTLRTTDYPWHVWARSLLVVLIWCDMVHAYRIKDQRRWLIVVLLGGLFFGCYVTIPLAAGRVQPFWPLGLLMAIGLLLSVAGPMARRDQKSGNRDISDVILAVLYVIVATAALLASWLDHCEPLTALWVMLGMAALCYTVLFVVLWLCIKPSTTDSTTAGNSEAPAR